ncbi:MAG: YggS family pyridoxal phosphate-dependent enzyme, partial [Anaerolineales bacterium]
MLDQPAIRSHANPPADQAALAARLAQVRERIAQAARRAGRDPAAVTLVAVSKNHPAESVAALAAAGQGDFGENRIEESGPKLLALQGAGSLRWHMIGHVQSRKAREVVQAGFTLVHSLDTLRLAGRLSRLAVEAGRRQAVLFECNVSGEA